MISGRKSENARENAHPKADTPDWNLTPLHPLHMNSIVICANHVDVFEIGAMSLFFFADTDIITCGSQSVEMNIVIIAVLYIRIFLCVPRDTALAKDFHGS